MNGEPTERCGFWLGNPLAETVSVYNEKLGNSGLAAIQDFLEDDIRWISPQHMPLTYRHPDGQSLRHWRDVNPMAIANGPFAHFETVEELDGYKYWPQIKYLDFSEALTHLQQAGDHYRLSGFWSPIFHDLASMLGTEEMLIKMYTHPELIHAILGRLCDFYLEANELFYQQAGNQMDAHFMASDFGSQNDLIMSPELFEEFFLPWLRKFATQAHQHGYHSVLHCCGSIYRIIDSLADAGIDCIHPIQALAANMNAEYLAENFKGRMKFMGGIDTQHLLPEGSTEDVIRVTLRVIRLLSPGLIVSPSHESLLPNVPFENVMAMVKAVKLP